MSAGAESRSAGLANPLPAKSMLLVTSVGGAEGSRGAAAALACAAADIERAALLVEVGGRPPRPTLLASVAAQRLEERLAAHLPAHSAAARGQVCHLTVPAEPEGLEAVDAATTVARERVAVLHLPPPLLHEWLDARRSSVTGVLLRADLHADRALTALVARGVMAAGLPVAVLKRRLAWVAERRALFGALPPGAAGALPPSICRRLLPCDEASAGSDRLAAVP